MKTRLGWTLQGPAQRMRYCLQEQQCLFTSTLSPPADIYSHVEKLWQMGILPWQSEKACTHSRQNIEALALLESRTIRVDIGGIQRYATLLLHAERMPPLKTPKEAVLPQLSHKEELTERPRESSSLQS